MGKQAAGEGGGGIGDGPGKASLRMAFVGVAVLGVLAILEQEAPTFTSPWALQTM